MKAYSVICEKYFPGVIGHYCARNIGQVKSMVLSAIRESYPEASIIDLVIRRKKQFDYIAIQHCRSQNIDGLLE